MIVLVITVLALVKSFITKSISNKVFLRLLCSTVIFNATNIYSYFKLFNKSNETTTSSIVVVQSDALHFKLKNYNSLWNLFNWFPILSLDYKMGLNRFGEVVEARANCDNIGFVSNNRIINQVIRKYKTLVNNNMNQQALNGCKSVVKTDCQHLYFKDPIFSDIIDQTLDNLSSEVVNLPRATVIKAFKIPLTMGLKPMRKTSNYVKIKTGRPIDTHYIKLDNITTKLIEPETIGLYNCDVDNFEYSIRNRVIFDCGEHDSDHEFCVRYRKFFKKFCSRVVKEPIFELKNKREFINTNYAGQKKNDYLSALDDLEHRQLNSDDMRVEAFIKKEPMALTKHKKLKDWFNPRAIQKRKNGNHVMVGLGLQFKNFEHAIYKSNNLFNSKSKFPEVAKGKNCQDRRDLIVAKWRTRKNAVCIGLDGSNFDARLKPWVIEQEIGLYRRLLNKFGKSEEDKRLLFSLLQMQIKNKGKFRDRSGTLRYTVLGNRMSGDWNTALGNIIIMTTVICHFCNFRDIKDKNFEVLNDGDDILLFIDRSDLNKVETYLVEDLGRLGFDMKLKVFNKLEDIEFCQMKMFKTNNGYLMGKDPVRYFSRYQHQVLYNRINVNFMKKIKAQALSDIITYFNMPFIHNFNIDLFNSIKIPILVEDYNRIDNSYRVSYQDFKKAFNRHDLRICDDNGLEVLQRYSNLSNIYSAADEMLHCMKSLSQNFENLNSMSDQLARLRVNKKALLTLTCDESEMRHHVAAYVNEFSAQRPTSSDQVLVGHNKLITENVKIKKMNVDGLSKKEISKRQQQSMIDKKKVANRNEVVVKFDKKSKIKEIDTTSDMDQRKTRRPVNVIKSRSYGRSGASKRVMEEARALMNQCINPYASQHLIRWPDEMGSEVAVVKSFQSSFLQPKLYTSVAYLGIIHVGRTNCQALITTDIFPTGYIFTVASFNSSSTDGNSLIDSIQSTAPNPRLSRVLGPSAAASIPMRSGFIIDSNNNSYLWSPSDIYDGAGNPVTVTGYVPPSMAPNLAFAVPPTSNGYTVSITFTFTASATSGNLAFTYYGLQGATSTNIVTQTFSIAQGYNAGTIDYQFGASTYSGFLGVVMSNTGTGSIRFVELAVNFVWNAGNLAVASNVCVPYSCWTGISVRSMPTLNTLVQSERTTASSLLLSDFSAVLVAAGGVSAAQIYTGTYPAESGVTGFTTCSAYKNAYNAKERNGLYSAPAKIIDVNSAAFNSSFGDWLASQPYTVTFFKVPASSNTLYSIRAQFADIIEYKCDNQQVLDIDTAPPNREIASWIKYAMINESQIMENPLHLEMIPKFILRALSLIPKYVRAVSDDFGDMF